jgi:hypothetical protein
MKKKPLHHIANRVYKQKIIHENVLLFILYQTLSRSTHHSVAQGDGNVRFFVAAHRSLVEAALEKGVLLVVGLFA